MAHPVFDGPTHEAVAFFQHNGWVRCATLDAAQTSELSSWVDEVAAWPLDGGPWLHYREQTDDGPKLCRTENFVPSHPGLARLLTAGVLVEVAAALLGEPAVLYKEKINYKLAGGAGYSPHQDAPAYRFIEVHISAMVAVDDASRENGGLEVVSRCHDEVLPMDESGCIHPDVVARLDWEPVDVRAGETLFFHSRTPHRSGPNLSEVPRRAIYPTYNARSEGDLRDAYYRQKLAEFAEGAAAGSGVQVSLIGDFQGRPVR